MLRNSNVGSPREGLLTCLLVAIESVPGQEFEQQEQPGALAQNRHLPFGTLNLFRRVGRYLPDHHARTTRSELDPESHRASRAVGTAGVEVFEPSPNHPTRVMRAGTPSTIFGSLLKQSKRSTRARTA